MRLLEALETSLMILFWPFTTAFAEPELIVYTENLLAPTNFNIFTCSFPPLLDSGMAHTEDYSEN